MSSFTPQKKIAQAGLKSFFVVVNYTMVKHSTCVRHSDGEPCVVYFLLFLAAFGLPRFLFLEPLGLPRFPTFPAFALALAALSPPSFFFAAGFLALAMILTIRSLLTL